MKKITSFIFCAVLLGAGCTNPEQDQKIKSFWMQQYLNVMMKVSSMSSGNPADAMSNLSADRAQKLEQLTALLQASLNKANPPEQTPVEVAQPVEEKPAPVPAPVKKKAAKAAALPQVLEVTMDEAFLPGKASVKERTLMKEAFDEVQLDNQEILQDIQTTFGEDVKVKAFLITTRTETELKKAAAEASNFKGYLKRQKQIVDKQKTALQQLMQQNAGSIKPLKQYK
ncbi:MAG: hypothetical protein IKP06_02870 [Elusimicrobiaceae bacterium]|nr:hypothetical protein [Elusimicrobiaceae bacterium]